MNASGYYFMKMHQERSYVVAIEDAEDVEGMYIDEEKEDILLEIIMDYCF